MGKFAFVLLTPGCQGAAYFIQRAEPACVWHSPRSTTSPPSCVPARAPGLPPSGFSPSTNTARRTRAYRSTVFMPPASHRKQVSFARRTSFVTRWNLTVRGLESGRWFTFTLPQAVAHAPACGLFLRRREHPIFDWQREMLLDCEYWAHMPCLPAPFPDFFPFPAGFLLFNRQASPPS